MNATKMHALPRLRFPEFAGQWETRTLRDHGISVIDGDRGKNYPNGDDFSAKGYCLFLNAKNVTSSGFAFSDVSFISEEKDRQLSKGKLEAEDVVLTTRGTVGNIAFFGRDIPYRQMRINSGMVLLRTSDKKISPQFLYSAFFAPPLDGEVKRTAFGSAQPQLTVKGIYALNFGAPSLPEQRKIADFLTAVDGRIQQLSQKRALLQDYKKGVMQQLFTQALRFKDDHGNDFPDWEEKTLGEVLTIGSGRDYKHLGKGDVPVYGSGGVMTFVDASLYDGESVCIGRKGTIDKPRFLEGAFWTVDTLFYTHSFIRVIPRFIYAVFQQINWQTYNEASGVPSLSKSTIESIPVSIPHPAEQTKIANFLTALDRKIESVAHQITHTQTFKRGLLQQMFV